MAEWRRLFSTESRVVEVGLQVREHQDRGEEEDGEGQVEVERERSKRIKDNNTCATCG